MKEKKSSTLTNTLVLVVVTFVAVLALSVVYQITKEPIKQAEINARAEIYTVVYPNAASFSEIENSQEIIDASADLLAGAGYNGCFVNDALAVKDNSGNIEGYVIAATSPSGYGGNVQIAIGIKNGKITGFDVVDQSETAGLGSKCTEPTFKSQFTGKSATALEYTKSGAAQDNQIDAISGATITTNAVTEAVNAAIVFYQENFGSGAESSANEPEQSKEPEKSENTTDATSGATPASEPEKSDDTTDAASGATSANGCIGVNGELSNRAYQHRYGSMRGEE